MKALAVAAALALVSTPLRAAAPRSRTLAQLIATAESAGSRLTVGAPLSSDLGFANPFAGRTLSYDERKSSDQRGHDFTVVRDGSRVVALIWGNTGLKDGIVDGLTFRTTGEGKLVSAVESRGKLGHVGQIQLNVKDRRTQRLFDAEVRFFLVESTGLRPDK